MRTTRRRFITISAAAGGLPLLPVWAGRAAPSLRTWTGAALGAGATLQIHHPDPAAADHSISASLAEVARLESVLSLYRPDSALSRLNRGGILENPCSTSFASSQRAAVRRAFRPAERVA